MNDYRDLNSKCLAACDCDPAGSSGSGCDESGVCKCKENYAGIKCDAALGPWTNVTNATCQADNGQGCGPGIQITEERTCTDGRIQKCADLELERTQVCDSGSCNATLGNWTSVNETCIANDGSNCGPGTQVVENRTCTDGVIEKCSSLILERTQSCNLGNCNITLGNWTAVSQPCVANGGSNCGPGTQIVEERNCTDGIIQKCEDFDLERNQTCDLGPCDPCEQYKAEGADYVKDQNNDCFGETPISLTHNANL